MVYSYKVLKGRGNIRHGRLTRVGEGRVSAGLCTTPIPGHCPVVGTIPLRYGPNSVRLGWRFGVAVMRWSRSTQLLYIEPG